MHRRLQDNKIDKTAEKEIEMPTKHRLSNDNANNYHLLTSHLQTTIHKTTITKQTIHHENYDNMILVIRIVVYLLLSMTMT